MSEENEREEMKRWIVLWWYAIATAAGAQAAAAVCMSRVAVLISRTR